ncbi:MAG: DUF2085 domain-containing protein [Chloroflexi bacterium]|nr:DUF2085 domain-containing protein [Chloroflexota bacterium]GIW11131.1 MAG: hypothetical protein KatS3mg061_2188 [Dehalococcoidia bacterium]
MKESAVSARTVSCLEQVVNRLAEGLVRVISHHWLVLVNGILVLYLALAVLAPLLMAWGLSLPGRLIYLLFRALCHQLPSHSYFLAGHQLACCQRCTAIYGSLLLGGLLFSAVRGWLRPLPWKGYLFFIAPMAVDGLTQLFGWRESTWELRTLTGGLFGLATVWLMYPLVQRTMVELRGLLHQTGGLVTRPL